MLTKLALKWQPKKRDYLRRQAELETEASGRPEETDAC